MLKLKLFWVFSLLIACAGVNAQVTKIKLAKKTHMFKFEPDTNVLYRWQEENVVNVSAEPDTGILFFVKGINMDVVDIGGGDYQLKPYHSDTTFFQGGKLLVYKVNALGEKQIHTAKEFRFIDPKLPRIKVHDVSPDSIIQKGDLVNAKIDAYHKGNKVLVLSYVIKREVNDSTTVDEKILGCEFPINLKNKYRRLSDGSVIYFYDIRVKLVNGFIETIPRVTYFVEDNYHPFIEKTN